MIEGLGILGAVIAASVLGSLHCAGMCGGLVLFAVNGDGTMRKSRALHFAYHGGRGIAYAMLGLLAGSLGAAADMATTINSNARTSAIIAGIAMVVIGVITLAQNSGVRVTHIKAPGFITRQIQRAHTWAFGLPPTMRASAVGLLTPLLPCGWLYAFVIVAAGTGNLFAGAAVMIAFWLGTLPVMGTLGFGADKLTGSLRRRLPYLTGFVAVGLGLATVFGRVSLPSSITPNITQGDLNTQLNAVRSMNHDEMLCGVHGAYETLAEIGRSQP